MRFGARLFGSSLVKILNKVLLFWACTFLGGQGVLAKLANRAKAVCAVLTRRQGPAAAPAFFVGKFSR